MPLFPFVVTLFLKLTLTAASRGEASLEPAVQHQSASGAVHQCKKAVRASQTAKSTIEALKDCIEILEKYSKESDHARRKTKHDVQQYSSDMNLLGSFLQSLQQKIAATYHTDSHDYNHLRSKQQKALAVGFIERHKSTKASKSGAKHTARNRKQKVKRKKTHRKTVPPKEVSRHQRAGHLHKAHGVPSFLQLSADEHAEFAKVDLDLQKLEESFRKQLLSADQQAEAAETAQKMLQPTSLLQLSEGDGEGIDGQESKDSAASSFLEEDAPSFASLFWKPWKLQDEKNTLHHIVGFGLTKDDSQAHTDTVKTA